MELKNLVLKKVMYYMQSFVVSAGGESFEVPRSMIQNIDIAKDYDAMFFPLWYVCINVPNWFYSQMAKNPDSISVSMNLQYAMATENEKLISGSTTMTTDIAGNFKAIIPSSTQTGDYTIQKDIENDADAYKKNYAYGEHAFVELLLYNTAAYNAAFTNLNAVISSTNVTDAVTYCFNKCGISNVLLTKSDNNTTYSEFKILPQSGISNILRIVENYKFHNEGSTIFFDLVDSYLVTNKLGCYAWKNNEYKSTQFISISEYSEALGSYNGLCVDNKEKCNIVVMDKNSFSFQDVGTNPMMKNTGETELLTIRTKNITLNMLTPNKEFIVNIDSPDNKKSNGKYRLMSVSATMVPSGEFLDPIFTIVLRR